MDEDAKKKSTHRPKKSQKDDRDYYGDYDRYYPYYYHDDYYRGYYEEEYYHYEGNHAQYLNRYERMSRYGPYDEEAEYPHDYFDHQRGSKYSEDHYKRSRHPDDYHKGSR